MNAEEKLDKIIDLFLNQHKITYDEYVYYVSKISFSDNYEVDLLKEVGGKNETIN